MADKSGLIIGQLQGKPSYWEGVTALFNPRLNARDAVTPFLQSCQGRLNRKPQTLVRLNNAVHCTIVAPTGVGKNVSCALPFLFTCPDSCAVVDFKGENYRITSDARRRMGHRVIRLDPFGVCGPGSDTYNPMSSIDPDNTTAIDDCRVMAESIVVRGARESEPYWDDSAEIWIGAMICAMVAFAPPHQRNLQSVRAQLADPALREATIKMMCESSHWSGMLSRYGNSLKNYQGKTLDSVLTATNRHFTWADTIAVAESMRESSFNPADLLNGKTTIYLILPYQHIRTQSALLRLWIGSLLRAVIAGGLQEKNKVHFVMDEANSLSRMDQLSDILTIGRGYGIRMQLYYQDLGQIRKCWPDGTDQTLLANSSQVWFGVNDQSTAEYVSNRLGEQTIIVASGGSSTGETYQSPSQDQGSRSTSTNTSHNWSQIARKLLKPEEVTLLSPRTAIVFTPGVLPIASTLVRYYEPSFRKPRRKGLFMATAETVSLFITVAMIAALCTAVFFPNILEVLNVQGIEGLF